MEQGCNIHRGTAELPPTRFHAIPSSSLTSGKLSLHGPISWSCQLSLMWRCMGDDLAGEILALARRRLLGIFDRSVS